MKLCKKCGINKPLTEFYKDNHLKDGFTNSCKNCIYSKKEKLLLPIKICKKCGIEKILDDFPTDRQLLGSKMNTCKLCFYNYQKNKRLKIKIEKIKNGEIKIKICNICKDKLRIGKFNKSNLTEDGYLNNCKFCSKKIKEIENKKHQTEYFGLKKMCNKCKKEKDINLFHKCKKIKDGHFSECIDCKRNTALEYNNNFYKKGISKKRQWDNEERKLLTKLKRKIRTGICNLLKSKGFTKNSHTLDILGCSIEELKFHLESKFEPWMNWGNHGLYNGGFNYGWDIDHIIPVSSGKTEEELLKLNHFTNLQPLCSIINRYIKKDLMDFKN